jgi:hypothetical protein
MRAFPGSTAYGLVRLDTTSPHIGTRVGDLVCPRDRRNQVLTGHP